MKKILTILTVSLILTSCACDTPKSDDVVTTDSTNLGMDLSDTSVFTPLTSVTTVIDTTVTE